jgi:hypothetical protein
MHAKTRIRLNHRSLEEKGAINTLLDCANTTLLQHSTINQRPPSEAICPWVHH